MTNPTATPRATCNHILSNLSASDFGLLESHLKSVDLPLRLLLEDRGKPIRHVYFVERGIVSVVANGQSKRTIEVGIIGPEGMTGFALVMGAQRAANQSYVQMSGAAQRIKATDLRLAIEQSVTLHRAFLNFCNSFANQTAQTALANGRSKIEERLARWLLMAHDRIDGDEMVLTHEFLSTMLGVRRAGVTEALNVLKRAGLVGLGQGVIAILDRAGLEKSSDGTYRA
jgi:CRP-like cAMP-binding protein